jgi:PAS domain S-box-containing protein
MLENKNEELACLRVLGLLSESEEQEYLAGPATSPEAIRCEREFRDSLTNLALSATVTQLPPDGARERLFERIAREPARVATDAEGRILAINPSFTDLCGYRLSDLRGKKPGQVLQGPKTCPQTVETLRRAVANGEPCELEMLNYHKNGSPYWVRIAIQPQRNDQGELVGFEAEETKLPMPAGI